jgi:hypothetical protein
MCRGERMAIAQKDGLPKEDPLPDPPEESSKGEEE